MEWDDLIALASPQHNSKPTSPVKDTQQSNAALHEKTIHEPPAAPRNQQQPPCNTSHQHRSDDYSNPGRQRAQQQGEQPQRERHGNHGRVPMPSSRNINIDHHHRDRSDKRYLDEKDRSDQNCFRSRHFHSPRQTGRDRVREGHTSRHDGRNNKRSRSTSSPPRPRSRSRWRDDRDKRNRHDPYTSEDRRTRTTPDNHHRVRNRGPASSYASNDHQTPRLSSSRLSSPSLPSTNTHPNSAYPSTGRTTTPTDTFSPQPPDESTSSETNAGSCSYSKDVSCVAISEQHHVKNPTATTTTSTALSHPSIGSITQSDTVSQQPPDEATSATSATDAVSSFDISECQPSPPHVEYPPRVISSMAASTTSASMSATATEPPVQSEHLKESTTATTISLQKTGRTVAYFTAPLSVIPSYDSLASSSSSSVVSPTSSPPTPPTSSHNLVVVQLSTPPSVVTSAQSPSIEHPKPRRERTRQSQGTIPMSSNETLTVVEEQSQQPVSSSLLKRPRQHQRTLAELHADGFARGHYEIVSTAPRKPIVSFDDPTVIVESAERVGPVPTQHQQGQGLSIDHNYVGLHSHMMHKVRFHMTIKMFGTLHHDVKSKPYKYHSCACRYLNSLFHDAARIKSHIKSMIKNACSTEHRPLPLPLPPLPIEHHESCIQSRTT